MRLEDEIQQKEFKAETQKAYVNLIFTHNWIESKAKDFFKEYELTTQQYNILRILRGQHPNTATVNLLKDRMLDKMCDASRMVERLKTKGLVTRKVNEKDRRAADVIITDKGLSLLGKIDKSLNVFESNLMSLSNEELQQLNHLLDKLRG